MYTLTIKCRRSVSDQIDLIKDDTWSFDSTLLVSEYLVKNFTWAQWDPVIQALYYIHLKPATRSLSLLEKDDNEKGLNPTLSAFQFHDDLPTETVVRCNL